MEREPCFRFGSFTLDAGARSLTRQGEGIDVEPKVLDLMLHLIEHRERVVPQAELLRSVWPSVAVTPSSLARAVYKARRALGDNGRSQRTISTVHGRGFRFIAPLRGGPGEEPDGASSASTGRRQVRVEFELRLAAVLALAPDLVE